MVNLYGHSAREAAKILGVKMSYMNSVVKGYQKEPISWAGRLSEARTGAPGPLPLPNDLKAPKSATAQSQTPRTTRSVGGGGAPLPAAGASVILPSPQGEKEHDIMPDGFARGYPGDSTIMRAYYRTPQALRRILEHKNNAIGCRFAGMGDLPQVYKITSDGGVVTLFNTHVNFDTRPTVGTSAGK